MYYPEPELTVENVLCEIDYPSVVVYIHEGECHSVYEGEGEINFIEADILERRVKHYESSFSNGTLHITIYI